MGLSIERLVRDKLVNDSTIRGFSNATVTSSARVYPNYMEVTGQYPLISYSEIVGATHPGLSACAGLITFMIETQATGGVNPYATSNNIAERIDQLFDDQNATGLALSGTAVYCFHVLRESSLPMSFDSERKTYRKFMTYSYELEKY